MENNPIIRYDAMASWKLQYTTIQKICNVCSWQNQRRGIGLVVGGKWGMKLKN